MLTDKIKPIVIISALLAIILPLGNIFVVLPAFKNVIVKNTEEEAERIANYFSQFVFTDDLLLKEPSAFSHKILQLQNSFKIEKFRVFSPDGRIVFSTDAIDIGTSNTNEYFRNIVAKGSKFTKVVKKDVGKTSEGYRVTKDVQETYVPLMDKKNFLGALEVYYDITDRQERLTHVVTNIILATLGIIVVLLFATNLVIFQESSSANAIQNKKTSKMYSSPFYPPVIIAVLIFVSESLVMLLISSWGEIGLWQEAILDSTLLVMLLAPVFYFFLVKPLVQNINDRRQTEKKLKKAKEEAVSANKAKSLFVANISHEIRTPMNHILGMSNLALDCEISPEIREFLLIIKSSARSLLKIINDILDFSKIEAEKIEFEDVRFSIIDFLDSLIAMFFKNLLGKKIDLHVIHDPTIPIELIGDPVRINQILINLINNAIKFTDEGEIVIRTRLVSQKENLAMISFSVSDTGIGISKEQTKKLFSSFTQADSSTTRKYGGTGLGLVICKRLVEMMGGEISLDSEYGKGSTFTFTLALNLPKGAVPAQSLIPRELFEKRILMIQDKSVSNKFMKEQINAYGIPFEYVESEDKGIAVIENASGSTRPYELVILDWWRNNSDIFATIDKIRACKCMTNVPVILIMPFLNKDEEKKAYKDGVSAIVKKPVSTTQLLNTICGLFGLPSMVVPNKLEELDVNKKRFKYENTVVLIVEDNDINQKIARMMLEKAGINIVLANNGMVAVEIIRQSTFDAVLIDIQMPIMDGFETTKILREDSRYDMIPIIAMTANAMAGDREKCLAVGMNDYVAKPIEEKELIDTLSRWLPADKKIKLATPADDNIEQQTTDDSYMVPGIDINTAMKKIGGDLSFILGMLKEFAKKHAGAAVEIRHSLANNDIDTAIIQIHTLKGLAGTIQAGKLQEVSLTLEKIIRDGTTEDLSPVIDKLESKLNQVLSSIAVLPDPKDGVIGTVESTDLNVTIDKIRGMILDLNRLLRENNLEAEDSFKELKDCLGSHYPNITTELGHFISDLEYVAAQESLDNLAEALKIQL